MACMCDVIRRVYQAFLKTHVVFCFPYSPTTSTTTICVFLECGRFLCNQFIHCCCIFPGMYLEWIHLATRPHTTLAIGKEKNRWSFVSNGDKSNTWDPPPTSSWSHCLWLIYMAQFSSNHIKTLILGGTSNLSIRGWWSSFPQLELSKVHYLYTSANLLIGKWIYGAIDIRKMILGVPNSSSNLGTK